MQNLVVSQTISPLDSEAPETEQQLLAYQRACLKRAQAEFLAITPRELRSSLTLIHGYAAMLAEMTKSAALAPEQVAGMVQRIINGTLQLAETVEDVLDLAAIRADALELLIRPISPTELLSLVAKGLRQSLAAYQQTLSIVIAEDLPSIEGDVARLRQALQNIVGLVVEQAAPDCVTMSCQLSGNVANAIACMHFTVSALGASSDLKHLAILAADSGAPEFLGEGEGRGHAVLKAAVAKCIIQAHHGRLWADISPLSDPKRAKFVFHIELPLRQHIPLPMG